MPSKAAPNLPPAPNLQPRAARGNIAVFFIPVLAVMLLLTMWVINRGQTGIGRVEVANCADAGALAGASWIASGQNECLWVVRKMFSAMAMLQALYLVPFCPDAEVYADDLWQDVVADDASVMAYFGATCNALMEDAWRMGSQASFSACYNNLMIRNQPDVSPGEIQVQFYESPGGTVTAEWTVEGIGDRTHTVTADVMYPAQQPLLEQADLEMSYLVWQATNPNPDPRWPKDWPGSVKFPCFDGVVSAQGFGFGGPSPDMGADWAANPLAVIGGLKGYEVDLFDGDRMALLIDIPYGDCAEGSLCFLKRLQTSNSPRRPVGILNSAASVGVSGTHSVVQDGGGGWGGGWSFGIPPANSEASVNAIEPWDERTWQWPRLDCGRGVNDVPCASL